MYINELKMLSFLDKLVKEACGDNVQKYTEFNSELNSIFWLPCGQCGNAIYRDAQGLVADKCEACASPHTMRMFHPYEEPAVPGCKCERCIMEN